jgi:hypothetical protein
MKTTEISTEALEALCGAVLKHAYSFESFNACESDSGYDFEVKMCSFCEECDCTPDGRVKVLVHEVGCVVSVAEKIKKLIAAGEQKQGE